MSNRNDYDYFDLNNFDDGYDSRDYRRRQPTRRQGSNNRRPHPPVQRSTYSAPTRRPTYNRRRRNNKRRTRNRAIIITGAIGIVVLLIVLLSVMINGCNNGKDNSKVSTETKNSQETTAAVEASKEKNTASSAAGDLATDYFKTPEIADDNSSGTMTSNIYVWKEIGFELFGSDDERAKNYADTVSGLADKLDGVKVYDMVIPNHTEYGLPQRLKDSDAPSTSQADNIKAVYEKLSNKVTPINAYNYLADHNSEYIYFNSDHHWTGLGAYYAYKAFADTNGLPALSLDNCTEQTIDGFTGTFTNLASGLKTDTVHYWNFPYNVTMDITKSDGSTTSYDSPYYSGAASGTLTYGVFIMGDNPLTVLKSGSENAEKGKKIAVVKESYGNAFVPYLTNNYEEVHVVDFRYFRSATNTDLAAYCKKNGITDVLFLNGVMSANTQIQLDSMSGLVD